MEGEMATCPKCKSTMHIEGTAMVCSNLTCTYQHEVHQTVPTQAKLWEMVREKDNRITELEDIIQQLTNEISHKKGKHCLF